MRVGLVAHFAEIRLVGCVDVHMLFAVAAVGEAPVTALKFALKGLFTYGRNKSTQLERGRILLWLLNDTKQAYWPTETSAITSCSH